MRYVVELLDADEAVPAASTPLVTLRQIYTRYPARREAAFLQSGEGPADEPTLIVLPATEPPVPWVPSELRLRTPRAAELLEAVRRGL